jgi:hypothetical protein
VVLHRRQPVALGDRINGLRVCWLGGRDKGKVLYTVMVEHIRPFTATYIIAVFSPATGSAAFHRPSESYAQKVERMLRPIRLISESHIFRQRIRIIVPHGVSGPCRSARLCSSKVTQPPVNRYGLLTSNSRFCPRARDGVQVFRNTGRKRRHRRGSDVTVQLSTLLACG